MTDFHVRPFRSDDAEAVVALWEDVLPSAKTWNEPNAELARKVGQLDELVSVGELDGKVVSTVVAGFDGVRGWVYRLAVDRSMRRRGYGRRMLVAVEEELRRRGCLKVNLQVHAENEEAVGFYRACGFVLEDRVSFGKPLAPNHEELPEIKVTDEITLSQLTSNDKPELLKHLNETPEISRYMCGMPFPYTPLDADVWTMNVANSSLARDRAQHWAIRDANRKVIGGVGLMNLTPKQKAELGYWLAKPYWGRGVMTSCVTSLCEFAFTQHQLRRLYAHVYSPNAGSARVLEKCGFELEATLRNNYFIDDEPIDALVYARLK